MAVVPDQEMLGRITVFSISGCPHCRAAKSLLKKKGVAHIEVNLDVYPELRPEVEARAQRSSVPQIFFNDELIGGNDSLQALEAKGELDAKLKWVFETPTPPTAPPLPVGGREEEPAAVGLASKKDEYADLVERLRRGVTVGDHFHFVHLHRNCFSGEAVVTFLAKDQDISRQQALALGNRLVEKHFLRGITCEALEDGSRLYRFLEHEMALRKAQQRCLNFSGTVDDSEPPPAVELGDQLRRLILAIYEEFLSEDGKAVDYAGIAKAESFRRYVKRAEELQRVELRHLSREECLAFFINIYNALVIHATVRSGSGPTTALQRKTFFSEFTYLMGGRTYSLSDIENGILRANRRAPYTFQVPFGPKDERSKVALAEHEPLIHFALVCGAKSCPPIKTYKTAGIYDALAAAARSFFEAGGIDINEAERSISLSKILYWYHVDFGATDEEMLKWIAQYLKDEEKDKLLGLLKQGSYKVTYQHYDWSANSH